MNDLNLLNKDVIDQHDIGYCSMASIVSNGDSSMFSVESEETCSSRFSYNNCDYTYEPKNTITKEKNNHEETHQIHTELESENILFLKDNKKEDLPQNYCKNDCINDLYYNENYEKSVNIVCGSDLILHLLSCNSEEEKDKGIRKQEVPIKPYVFDVNDIGLEEKK